MDACAHAPMCLNLIPGNDERERERERDKLTQYKVVSYIHFSVYLDG